MTQEEAEAVYDAEIAPALLKITERCKELGIHLVAHTRDIQNIGPATMARNTGTRYGMATIADDAEAEVDRLRKVMARAAEIIDANLYHQREKVEDASAILKQALKQK